MLFLNLRACNTWKELWGEDADEWKPERWIGQLPASVADAHIPNVFANTLVFLCVGEMMRELRCLTLTG